MLANRQKDNRHRRTNIERGSRRERRNFQPWSEALESRALLALFPGNPIAVPAPSQFFGAGTASAQTALIAFQAAVGGANNGNTGSPQTGGFRTIDWDAVNLTGTDFGGGANTTVITQGQTAGIPPNRFQTRGVFFDEVYAVSGNGFTNTANVSATTFPSFSPSNTFAPFNGNKLDLSFVLPSGATTTPVPAATRGFGAIFILGGAGAASSIEYFSGDRSLATVPVPAGPAGQTEFVGALFPDALVTRVTLTLGTGTLFSFNGTTAVPSNLPAGNLAVTDDFAYAEPVPRSSLPPVLPGPQGTTIPTAPITATVGGAFTGTVATFSDTDPTATAKSFNAVINYGDGKIANGTVNKNAQGGFDVSGTNTFTRSGRIPVSVRVQKFDQTGTTAIDLTNTAEVAAAATTITLAASPTSAIAGQPVTFTATVAAPQGTNPTGNVTFLDGTNAIAVVPVDSSGKATFTTTALTRGSHSITAVYNGDASFNTSTSTATAITVRSDVTNQIRITLGSVRRRRGQFTQHVDVANTGDALPGPIVLVLDKLPTASRLVNASGTTQNQAPLGSPFIVVTNSGLAQNGTAGVDLILRGRSPRAVRFTPRVLAGSSPA